MSLFFMWSNWPFSALCERSFHFSLFINSLSHSSMMECRKTFSITDILAALKGQSQSSRETYESALKASFYIIESELNTQRQIKSLCLLGDEYDPLRLMQSLSVSQSLWKMMSDDLLVLSFSTPPSCFASPAILYNSAVNNAPIIDSLVWLPLQL